MSKGQGDAADLATASNHKTRRLFPTRRAAGLTTILSTQRRSIDSTAGYRLNDGRSTGDREMRARDELLVLRLSAILVARAPGSPVAARTGDDETTLKAPAIPNSPGWTQTLPGSAQARASAPPDGVPPCSS